MTLKLRKRSLFPAIVTAAPPLILTKTGVSYAFSVDLTAFQSNFDSIYGRLDGILGQFSATTSAQLAAVISDDTGTGVLVFGTAPTLSAPKLAGSSSGTTTVQAAAVASGTVTIPAGTYAVVTDSLVQTVTNKILDNTSTITLKDTLFTLQDDGDTTKQARFQLSGITTATLRTYTLPDVNGTLLYSGGPLGTPASGVLTSCTGLPVSSGISGLGSGIAAALAVNVGGAGAPVLINSALGTPSSGTLTSCTGLPIASGVSGLGTGVATFLATPSSANLAAALTDEDSSGVVPFETTGTWTPGDSSGAALTFTAVSASYTRIGNMVHAYGTVTYPSTANGATALIGGLPVTVPNTAAATALPSPVRLGSGSLGAVMAATVQNTGSFNIYSNSTSANLTNAQLSGITVRFNVMYPAT